MSKLFGAMKLKIKEIVLVQDRPFSFLDFAEFEVSGQPFKMSHGTFRNYISILKKAGKVKLYSSSKPAFYTIPGKKFNKAMTHTHAGVLHSIIPERLLKDTPIYRWLKNKPVKKQALHDIRLTFKAAGIWNAFSNLYADKVNPANKDIQLPTLTFFNYIDVIVTIHHTNTVTVAIACSLRPIAIDAKDMFQLFEALTRTEIYIANSMDKSRHNSAISAAHIPSYRSWIVKLWHFGIDTLDAYGKEGFHVTFEEGISDVYRIYTKRKGSKDIVRVEHQEYPNQAFADAAVRKLFPDGHLVVPGGFRIMHNEANREESISKTPAVSKLEDRGSKAKQSRLENSLSPPLS